MISHGKLGFTVFLILALPLGSFAEPRPAVELHAPDGDSTWERIEEDDGVTIFVRERPGGPVKEGLGKGVLDAPPCRVFQVLTDSDHLVEFMPYVKARIVKNAGRDWEYGCQYLDFPWPLWDRFVNFRVDRIQNYRNNACEYFLHWRKDETYSCTIEEVKEAYGDARRDPVVPPTNEGYWHLLPHEGGKKTLAYYYVFTDPGGNVPGWLKNLFVDDAIVRLFQAVRERIQKNNLYSPCQCHP